MHFCLQLVGIDLSLLTAALYPPEALAEPDEPWGDFEVLLQRVAQVGGVGRDRGRLRCSVTSVLVIHSCDTSTSSFTGHHRRQGRVSQRGK